VYVSNGWLSGLFMSSKYQESACHHCIEKLRLAQLARCHACLLLIAYCVNESIRSNDRAYTSSNISDRNARVESSRPKAKTSGLAVLDSNVGLASRC
jgi:hypothetical protein